MSRPRWEKRSDGGQLILCDLHVLCFIFRAVTVYVSDTEAVERAARVLTI